MNLQTCGIEPRDQEGRKKCMIYLRGSQRDGSVGYSMCCFSRGHRSILSTCIVAENQVWRSDTFFQPQQASSTKTEDMNIDRYMVQDINTHKQKFKNLIFLKNKMCKWERKLCLPHCFGFLEIIVEYSTVSNIQDYFLVYAV